ncbi:MAG TPA: helix-turn-helix transcriptional regulator [Ferruginibacter sp.]|nr:helix-turn-helix transcriptional regulator [Ferruginibacter sp.]
MNKIFAILAFYIILNQSAMSFGTKLKMLRTQYKLDQDQMAKRLSVSQPVYSRYEANKKRITPSDDFVNRVACEFDVTPDWLTADADQNVFFETGSIATGATGIGQVENYYSVPKDFMDAFLKQQKMLEKMFTKYI